MVIKYGAPDIDLLSFVFENEGGNQDKPVHFSTAALRLSIDR